GVISDQEKTYMTIMMLPLLLNHFFAKAGLFWITGLIKKSDYKDWGIIRENKLILTIFIIMVLALIGMPPFPGFWGKWNLILVLSGSKQFFWVAIILLGSLFEAGYMLKWLGVTLNKKYDNDIIEYNSYKVLAIEITNVMLLFVTSYYFIIQNIKDLQFFLPFTAGLALFGLKFLPEKIKGLLSLIAISAYAYMYLPLQGGIIQFFNSMFLFGAFILIIATMNRKEKSASFYGLLMLMIGSLVAIVNADNILHFFLSWEIMTISSYLLINRGKNSEAASFKYIMFSLGGAFLILLGFGYAFSATPQTLSYGIFALAGEYTSISFILISLGFLIKSAALGVHIWIAGAYAKAEDDVTPFISALLSKSGIFGFVILLITMGAPKTGSFDLAYILGWIGVLTALIGTMMAMYQEDAKKLLAYSSMGQVGYIILALSIMSGLGWTAAMFQMINHFLIKGILFLSIAGVIYRTGTSDMYKMGGLIKKMPWSFTAVMFGIIAISGVPPLTGFGAKWLLYEALIEKGWYLQTGFAFFASTVAFLYCFRLIHAIFLGQPKTEFRKIKEAPAWFIVPQYIFIMVIFLFSIFPKLLIERISAIVDPFFGQSISWKDGTAMNSLGYWNGTTVMTIVGVIFVILLAILIIKMPKIQKVKQFNIVFAGERPETPELTHYAYEFYKPYRKALGWMVTPLAKRFWAGVSEWTYTISDTMRKIYTGNAQTYIFYIILTCVVLFFITVGVK
ncbi:MAG: NADH-quinone oxidoreductase subunit F, partial [Candidatus Delongbacteria bacterium]|nr:NADH-quinone oxidoreductase subunit F [Candidatus Delongbacteria bacterium]